MPATATSKQRPPAVEEGMTPKKTALIIVTVIGCIAILWPKVFHPMMFGGVPPPKPNLKDQRAAPGGESSDFLYPYKKALLDGIVDSLPHNYIFIKMKNTLVPNELFPNVTGQSA